MMDKKDDKRPKKAPLPSHGSDEPAPTPTETENQEEVTNNETIHNS